MSLADELLADLEDGEEEDLGQDDPDTLGVIPEVEEVVMEMDTKTQSLSSIAKLRDSNQVCGGSVVVTSALRRCKFLL